MSEELEHKKFKGSTDKINEALGIGEGESIDDVLAGFDDELSNIETNMQSAVDKIDNELATQSGDIHSLTQSLGELSDLIKTSKAMLSDVYDYVSSSEIMDPDVIGAGADLLKASNELIREYLDLYKEKLRHFNSIEMEMIKAQNRKDLEQFKHDLKNQGGETEEVTDVVEYTQESVVKVISDLEASKNS